MILLPISCQKRKKTQPKKYYHGKFFDRIIEANDVKQIIEKTMMN